MIENKRDLYKDQGNESDSFFLSFSLVVDWSYLYRKLVFHNELSVNKKKASSTKHTLNGQIDCNEFDGIEPHSDDLLESRHLSHAIGHRLSSIL